MMGKGVSKRIKSIKFAFLSPEEMRKLSATKIITADTYDDDGFPIDMGLMDPHLGVIEPGLRCRIADLHRSNACIWISSSESFGGNCPWLGNRILNRGVRQRNHLFEAARFKPQHVLVALVDPPHPGIAAVGPAHGRDEVTRDVLRQVDALRVCKGEREAAGPDRDV